jgi:hypothetical protein
MAINAASLIGAVLSPEDANAGNTAEQLHKGFSASELDIFDKFPIPSKSTDAQYIKQSSCTTTSKKGKTTTWFFLHDYSPIPMTRENRQTKSWYDKSFQMNCMDFLHVDVHYSREFAEPTTNPNFPEGTRLSYNEKFCDQVTECREIDGDAPVKYNDRKMILKYILRPDCKGAAVRTVFREFGIDLEKLRFFIENTGRVNDPIMVYDSGFFVAYDHTQKNQYTFPIPGGQGLATRLNQVYRGRDYK